MSHNAWQMTPGTCLHHLVSEWTVSDNWIAWWIPNVAYVHNPGYYINRDRILYLGYSYRVIFRRMLSNTPYHQPMKTFTFVDAIQWKYLSLRPLNMYQSLLTRYWILWNICQPHFWQLVLLLASRLLLHVTS